MRDQASPAGLGAATLKRNSPAGPFCLTAIGAWQFVIALMLVAAGFRWLRFEVAGLQVHPYLIPLAACFFGYGIKFLICIPPVIIRSTVFFVTLFAIASIPGLNPLAEILKLGASVLTIIAVATLTRTRARFNWGVIGLTLAVTLMSLRGLSSPDVTSEGINPLGELGNKNAFSLFAIPAVTLAAWVVLHERNLVARTLLSTATLAIVVAVFSSGNRSGWLGLVAAGAMLALYRPSRRSGRTIGVVLTLGIGSYYLHGKYGDTQVVTLRWQQTMQGYHSDELREQLVIESFKVALENPWLGATRSGLGEELVRRLQIRELDAIDTHNVIAFIAGATGFLTFVAFLWMGVAMWKMRSSRPAAVESRSLLRMLLMLWLLRGMFTHEILYSPAFSIAIGLSMGLVLIEQRASTEEATREVSAKRRRLEGEGGYAY